MPNERPKGWNRSPPEQGFSPKQKLMPNSEPSFGLPTRNQGPSQKDAYFPKGSGWNATQTPPKRLNTTLRDYDSSPSSVGEFFTQPYPYLEDKPNVRLVSAATTRRMPTKSVYTPTPVIGKQPMMMYPCPLDQDGNAIDSVPDYKAQAFIKSQTASMKRLAKPRRDYTLDAATGHAKTLTYAGGLKISKSVTGFAPGGFATILRR